MAESGEAIGADRANNKAASRKSRGLIVQFVLVGVWVPGFAIASGDPQPIVVRAAAWSASLR